jgi:hypothetical protein
MYAVSPIIALWRLVELSHDSAPQVIVPLGTIARNVGMHETCGPSQVATRYVSTAAQGGEFHAHDEAQPSSRDLRLIVDGVRGYEGSRGLGAKGMTKNAKSALEAVDLAMCGGSRSTASRTLSSIPGASVAARSRTFTAAAISRGCLIGE